MWCDRAEVAISSLRSSSPLLPFFSFCIIEGPETVQDFVQMQLQEIQDNIRSRRNKILLLVEEVRRLRVQQRIKSYKFVDENGEYEKEMPDIPSTIPFLPIWFAHRLTGRKEISEEWNERAGFGPQAGCARSQTEAPSKIELMVQSGNKCKKVKWSLGTWSIWCKKNRPVRWGHVCNLPAPRSLELWLATDHIIWCY